MWCGLKGTQNIEIEFCKQYIQIHMEQIVEGPYELERNLEQEICIWCRDIGIHPPRTLVTFRLLSIRTFKRFFARIWIKNYSF